MFLSGLQMVALDLDGTLVDTVPDLSYSIDNMLRRLAMNTVGEEQIREWLGSGVEQLVKRALTNSTEAEPDPSLLERAIPIFIDEYRKNVCNKSRLYEGVRGGLDYLFAKGFKLACITNKPGEFTDVILENLAIREVFGIVISGDTLAEKKPHPLPLLHAAEYFTVSSEQSLMVGDSLNDVGAARAAGFRIICVSYGYSSGQDIHAARPDYIIDSLSELADIF